MPRLECPIPDLEAELKSLLAQIPRGRVTTYGDLADALGLRSAARWVGEYLRDHPHQATCSCHRVVRKGGELGLYVRQRNPQEKAARLRREGIAVQNGTVVGFEEVAFRDFRSTRPRPLACLIEFQHEIARRVRLEPFDVVPKRVAGLDVSYCRSDEGIGACAIVETRSGELVWSTTRRLKVDLPYIPGLLTFRELPLLLSLYDDLLRQAGGVDLFLVDGNGILHPRGAGVAACFGVVADVPTIGVAKSFLCGRIEEDAPPVGGGQPVMLEGKLVGAAWRRNRDKKTHRIYISPGQGIDVDAAVRTVARLDFGHRLPEPLYWADRLSRAQAREACRSDG